MVSIASVEKNSENICKDQTLSSDQWSVWSVPYSERRLFSYRDNNEDFFILSKLVHEVVPFVPPICQRSDRYLYILYSDHQEVSFEVTVKNVQISDRKSVV